MLSATSLEGSASRLVRIVVLCAQIRDASSSERHKVPHISRGLLSRPPCLQLSERQGLLFVKGWWLI